MMRRLRPVSRLTSEQSSPPAVLDRGNAMVLTIAAVILTGMMMTVIMSTLLFSVGHTTATRASVESQAAAEGGAEQVAAYLMSRTNENGVECIANWHLDPTINPQPSWVRYEVHEVAYQTAPGSSWIACTPGDVIPALAFGLRVTTTGYSESIGMRGNSRGDQASVQITYTRPDSVTFNSAVHGENDIEANSDFNVEVGNDGPPDVVAKGPWYCPAMGRVQGNVYALDGVRDNTINTRCHVDGDFYVNGDLNFSSSYVQIGGRLIVNGNLQLTTANGVVVGGEVIVNGNLYMGNGGARFEKPVQVLGDFTTPGGGDHYEGNMGASFPGGLWVKGNVPVPSWNTSAFYGSFGGGYNQHGGAVNPNYRLNLGYPSPVDWQVPFNKINAWDSLDDDALDRLALWSEWPGWSPAPTPPVGSGPDRSMSALVTVLDIMFNPENALRNFPVLTRHSEIFAGMREVSWESLRPQYGVSWNQCTISNGSNPMPIQDAAIIDFTEICPGGVTIASANFELDGDLVIFATNITINGQVTINSGPLTTGNTKRSIYFIIPADDEDQTCASPTGNIIGNTGAWRQDETNTAAMLYALGTVNLTTKISSPNKFVGQIYGCTVRTPSGIDMKFSRVGQDSDITNTLFDLRWNSTRSITDLRP